MLRVLTFLALTATTLKSRTATDRGATAVEYGLMVAAIAAVIIIAVGTLGDNVLAAFDYVNSNWIT